MNRSGTRSHDLHDRFRVGLFESVREGIPHAALEILHQNVLGGAVFVRTDAGKHLRYVFRYGRFDAVAREDFFGSNFHSEVTSECGTGVEALDGSFALGDDMESHALFFRQLPKRFRIDGRRKALPIKF